MVRIHTDTAAVVALGTRIAGMAGGLDGAIAAVAARPSGSEPPATAAALADFNDTYRRGTQRLRDDVLALGRLTQASGAEYAAVEEAAARLPAAPVAPPAGASGG